MAVKTENNWQTRLWRSLRLTAQQVEDNRDLADMAPDSTRDNGARPWAWSPPLVSREEHERENPYHRPG